jgi:hypothetical protein
MVAKKYQNPSGGLNEAGRKFFKRTTWRRNLLLLRLLMILTQELTKHFVLGTVNIK